LRAQAQARGALREVAAIARPRRALPAPTLPQLQNPRVVLVLALEPGQRDGRREALVPGHQRLRGLVTRRSSASRFRSAFAFRLAVIAAAHASAASEYSSHASTSEIGPEPPTRAVSPS